MLTVKVISTRTSQPLEGAKVAVFPGSILRDSKEGHTNSRGEVHLDIMPGYYTLYINNWDQGKHKFDPGVNPIYYKE